ncbi:MAG: phage holin family protein, partial [Propionibacterium acidifaciens]
MEIVARTVGNAAGLWLATRLLSGLSVPEGVGTSHMWLNLLVLGLVLALVNSLIKPVAKFLTFPLYIITFGLFALVVNGAMLLLAGWLTNRIGALGAGGSVPLGLEVSTFGAAV